MRSFMFSFIGQPPAACQTQRLYHSPGQKESVRAQKAPPATGTAGELQLFSWKVALMIGILAASVFLYRFFCRFLCPLGAVYSLFATVSLFGIQEEEDKCIKCGKCVTHCSMDSKRVGDRECIHCGACRSVCPVHAISWKNPLREIRTIRKEKRKEGEKR